MVVLLIFLDIAFFLLKMRELMKSTVLTLNSDGLYPSQVCALGARVAPEFQDAFWSQIKRLFSHGSVLESELNRVFSHFDDKRVSESSSLDVDTCQRYHRRPNPHLTFAGSRSY